MKNIFTLYVFVVFFYCFLNLQLFSQALITLDPNEAFKEYMNNPAQEKYNIKCSLEGNYLPFHKIDREFLYLIRYIEKDKKFFQLSIDRVSDIEYKKDFGKLDLDQDYCPYYFIVNNGYCFIVVTNFKKKYFYYWFDCNYPMNIFKRELKIDSSFLRIIDGPNKEGKIWIYNEVESRFTTPTLEIIHSQLIEYNMFSNQILQIREMNNYPQYGIYSGNPDAFLIAYDFKLDRFFVKTLSVDIYLDEYKATPHNNVFIIKPHNSIYRYIIFSDKNKQLYIIPYTTFKEIGNIILKMYK